MPGQHDDVGEEQHRERGLSHVGSTPGGVPPVPAFAVGGRGGIVRDVGTAAAARHAVRTSRTTPAGGGVLGQLAQERHDPVGAVHDDVRQRHQRATPPRTPSRPAAWACPPCRGRRPPRRPPGRRGRRRRSRTRRRRAPRRAVRRPGPCACRPSAPRRRCGPARRPGRGCAARSRSSGSSTSLARSGSRIRRVWIATARPFSSTCASAAPARRRNRGSSREERRQPVRRPGADDPAVRRAPALVAVLPEDEQLLAGVADRVADALEPAEVEGLAGGAAGDDRDRAHLHRPGRRAPRSASGWMCADVGSSTIGASVPSKSSPMTASAAARTSAAYFCSPSTEPNSMPEANHIPAESPEAPSPRPPTSTVDGCPADSLSPSPSTLLACAALGGTGRRRPPTSHPPSATPSITATSAASVQVSVSVDSHGTATTVMVEYVTAGAYRAHRVPGGGHHGDHRDPAGLRRRAGGRDRPGHRARPGLDVPDAGEGRRTPAARRSRPT